MAEKENKTSKFETCLDEFLFTSQTRVLTVCAETFMEQVPGSYKFIIDIAGNDAICDVVGDAFTTESFAETLEQGWVLLCIMAESLAKDAPENFAMKIILSGKEELGNRIESAAKYY